MKKHRPRGRRPRVRRSCGQRGMTLIEITVVITIIGLVASIVAVSVMDTSIRETRNVTEVQIKSLSNALDIYSIRFGKHPATHEGLEHLKRTPKNKAPIIREIPNDPWGRPYVYVNPGVHNPGYFDLSSLGPDGEPGTDDDITNWGSDDE